MAQSVELLLDPDTEALVDGQWLALPEAGLPSEHRPQHTGSHRPHVTLFAGPSVPEPESSCRRWSPGRPGCRSSWAPCCCSDRAAASTSWSGRCCPRWRCSSCRRRWRPGAARSRGGQFGPGRWAAHLTLARRARAEDLPAMLARLPGESHAAPWSGSGAGTAPRNGTGCSRAALASAYATHREPQVRHRGDAERGAQQVQRDQADGQAQVVLGETDRRLDDLDAQQQHDRPAAGQPQRHHRAGDGGVDG